MKKAALVLALKLLIPSSAWAGEPLSVDDAVIAALKASPDHAEVVAATTTARGQLHEDRGFLDNPQASGSFSVTSSRTSLELVQPLSISGEGWHARAADRAGVVAADHDLVRDRLVVAANTRWAWAEAVLRGLRTTLAAEALDLSTRLRASVERRAELGEATDLDVRLARLAEASAAGELMASRRERDQAILALVGWTGVADPILPFDPFPAAPAPLGGPDERSDIVAFRARVEEADARLAQARAAAVPRVGVGAFIEDDGGTLSAGPALSFSIPVWSRNQGAVAAWEGQGQVAEKRQSQVALLASEERRLAEGRVSDADPLIDLGSLTMIDEARAGLAQIEAGYAAGELDLSDALLLRQQVVDGQVGVLALAGELIAARLDLLLATDDAALIPGGAP